MIYADNAATTKPFPCVLDAMKEYFDTEYANASQPYSFSRTAKKALTTSRQTVADLLNCAPDEIYWTSGGTEGDNLAIKSLITQEPKSALAISAIEHHAVSMSAKFVETLGHPLYIIPCNNHGTISPSDLQRTFDAAKAHQHKITLVSIMAANNEVGTVEPIKELCKLAHNNGAIFHTDAVAAMGHMELDLQDLAVDILSASSHKFSGPKGAGFVYLKKGLTIAPLLHGGGQERGMRSGTENIASIVGTAVALKESCDKLPETKTFLRSLEDEVLSTLKAHNIDFLRNGENQLPGHLSISIKGESGEALLHYLDLKGVCVSTGSACNSKATVLSQVLKAIKTPADYAKGTVRITFSHDNKSGDGVKIAALLSLFLTGA